MSHMALIELADRGLRACSTIDEYQSFCTAWTKANASQIRYRDLMYTQAEILAERHAEEDMLRLRTLVTRIESVRAHEAESNTSGARRAQERSQGSAV